MGKVSFIFRTDVHASDVAPVSWKGDYAGEIWSSLDQIGELARKYAVTAVLDGGDFFHVKAPTQNSHALVGKVSFIHQEYPCPVYCVEGNHDIKHNNLETLDQQPLGVLYHAKVFQHLREVSFESEGVRVRVVGFPYSPFRRLEELQALKKQGDEYLVAVVHALAGENPPAHVDEFFGEPVFRYGELSSRDGPDVFCFGHWHKDQGIVNIGHQWFVNQGAVSRGALSRENLSRTPKVALLDFSPTGVKVSSLPLKVLPASEVFDLEKKSQREAEKRSIEQYVERVRADLQGSTTDSEEDLIKSLNFARDIHEAALHYLQLARGGS